MTNIVKQESNTWSEMQRKISRPIYKLITNDDIGMVRKRKETKGKSKRSLNEH